MAAANGVDHTPAVDAFLAGDAEALLTALPEGVAFHSPVTDYTGGAAHSVLRALMGVLESTEHRSLCTIDEQTVLRFTSEIGGRTAEGVAIFEDDDLTLFVRPLEVLQVGIERMRAALAER